MKLRLFFILLFITSVSVSGYYFFIFTQNYHPIVEKIDVRFGCLIFVAVILQMAAHLIRAYKSRLLLNHIRKSKVSTLFRGLSVGYLFNSLLPFRLGEFIRAFYIGDALAISKTTVFMSIIFERLVDGILLGLSFLAAALLVHGSSASAFFLLSNLGYTLLIGSLLLGVLVYIIRSENRTLLRSVHIVTGFFNATIANRLRFVAWSGIYGTRLMLSDKRSLKKYYFLSISMWLIYFCSTASVVLAFFPQATINKALFIVQASYAGVATPTGPGYIGSFHDTVSRLFQSINLLAGEFTLLMWLVLTLPISLVGLFVLVKQRFEKKPVASSQKALLNKLHREKDISAELGHFLDAYLKGEEINRILTQAELDGKFRLIKSFKGGSNAHTSLVWQNREFFVKKITLQQYMGKLKDQAEWLLSRESLPHLPKVTATEETSQYYCFDLVYQKKFFPFFEFIHSHAAKDSFSVLKKTLDFMKRDIYQPKPAKNGRTNVLEYIEQKVIGKINDTAIMSSDVNRLLTYKKIRVNGKLYLNILPVIEKIKKNKSAMKELSSYMESPIHGDLTIDNLVTSPEGDFMILDPNNENQVSSPVVDYGKLYQSLHSGYEFLIQLEQCEVKGGAVHFEEAKSQKYAELFTRFDEQLKKQTTPKEYRTVLFHEAVHYCRMLTYRAHINPVTLPVFYCTAVKLFNEYIDQYEV